MHCAGTFLIARAKRRQSTTSTHSAIPFGAKIVSKTAQFPAGRYLFGARLGDGCDGHGLDP